MNSLQKRQIVIQPTYLVQISNAVQTLNHFYQQQEIGTLSNEYRNLLVSSFSNLNQNLQIYNNNEDASCLVQASVVKCKADLEIYCLEKVAFLLSRQTQQLGKIIYQAVNQYRNNVDDFQRIIVAERRKRIQNTENKKDAVIQKLKKQLVYRKQYISQLKERLNQVQKQNQVMYKKVIGNAKNITDRALSPSPKKNSTLSLNGSLTKLKSQAMLGSAHKTLSAKQVQQTIIDIMQTKQKQQNVKGKKSSLKNFLKTYFRYKFGMKELADELQLNFRQAVEFFSQSQQKNIFNLFLKIYSEQCEQQFFWQQRLFYEKLSKIIKRYLNQKDGIPIDQLNKMYQNRITDDTKPDIRLNDKDIQYILINVYKTSEVDSLQMILNQILVPKLQQSQSGIKQPMTIPSKKLINQILNYQLSRHLNKIQDIVKVIKDIDDQRGYLNQQNLQTAVVRLNIPQDKIQSNLSLLNFYQNKFLTHSQAIEIIQKIRKTKNKKK